MGLDRADLPGGELIAPYLAELAAATGRAPLHEAAPSMTPGDDHLRHGPLRPGRPPRFLGRRTASSSSAASIPTAPADDTVLVARVTDDDGQAARQPRQLRLPSDDAGLGEHAHQPRLRRGACARWSSRHTGAPCVFLQGARGDLGPREGFVGDPAVADRNGRQLGSRRPGRAGSPCRRRRTRFVYAGPVVSGATIGTWAHQPLPAGTSSKRRPGPGNASPSPLPYRSDLPDRDQTLAELQTWKTKKPPPSVPATRRPRATPTPWSSAQSPADCASSICRRRRLSAAGVAGRPATLFGSSWKANTITGCKRPCAQACPERRSS